MLAMSPREILQVVMEVDALQRQLCDAFFLQNPDVLDFKWLSDFPKAGELNIQGERWTYSKHGIGYRFANEHGCVIDAHNHFDKTLRVSDAHRLAEYLLASRRARDEAGQLHPMLEAGLKNLEQQSVLRKAFDGPLAWEARMEADPDDS